MSYMGIRLTCIKEAVGRGGKALASGGVMGRNDWDFPENPQSLRSSTRPGKNRGDS